MSDFIALFFLLNNDLSDKFFAVSLFLIKNFKFLKFLRFSTMPPTPKTCSQIKCSSFFFLLLSFKQKIKSNHRQPIKESVREVARSNHVVYIAPHHRHQQSSEFKLIHLMYRHVVEHIIPCPDFTECQILFRNSRHAKLQKYGEYCC